MNLLDKVKNKDSNNLKKKIKLGFIVLIPIIVIGIIICFRNAFLLSNEEIIEKVRNLDQYETIIEYTITNARGEYVEKAQLHCSKEHSPKMEFGDRLAKTYNKDSITMKYKDGKEYNLEKDTDSFYSLAIMSELFKNPIKEVKEESVEWGELEYLKVNIDILSKNNHLDKAILYINKQEKIPMLIKIFDINGKERVKIEYRDFNKKDKC